MEYFSGQGRVWAARRDDTTGAPMGFNFLGNCSQLVIALGRNYVRPDAVPAPVNTPGQTAARSGEPPAIQMTLDEFTDDNLALVIYGKKLNQSLLTNFGETVVAYKTTVFGHGNTVSLKHINLTSWHWCKNLAATTTYTQGVDYTVDLVHGTITFLSAGAIADGQSVQVYYDSAAYTKMGAGANTTPPYIWLRFEGMNTANNNSTVVIDVFQARLYPLENFPLISDAFEGMQLTGRIFKDLTQGTLVGGVIVPDDYEGQFVRIRKT